MFGVPTLVIGEETFWGLDAIDMAFDYLANLDLFNDPEMQHLDQMPVGATRRAKVSLVDSNKAQIIPFVLRPLNTKRTLHQN